jgi:hypothetical protein
MAAIHQTTSVVALQAGWSIFFSICDQGVTIVVAPARALTSSWDIMPSITWLTSGLAIRASSIARRPGSGSSAREGAAMENTDVRKGRRYLPASVLPYSHVISRNAMEQKE